MAQWHYGSSAGQHGPVEENELRAMIAAGNLGPETLVWRDGMRDWQPLGRVPELGANSPYSQGPPVPGYYPPIVPTSGLAIASMICGIAGYFTCYFVGLVGIPAVICGHMALNRINTSPYPMGGRGMAISGLILGYLGILITLGIVTSVVIAISTAGRP
jgi:hypothetical protein